MKFNILVIITYILTFRRRTHCDISNSWYSRPTPSIRDIKRYFIINTSNIIAYLLIIRVITTFEDNRLLFVTLDFTLLNPFFFFGSYAFKKNGSRLIIRVLRYKFTTDCKVEIFDLVLSISLFYFFPDSNIGYKLISVSFLNIRHRNKWYFGIIINTIARIYYTSCFNSNPFPIL